MLPITFPKFLSTKNPISIIFFLFLVNNVKSEFSFNFPNFPPEVFSQGLSFANNANLKDGIIQLTMKDTAGNPLQHSVGQTEWTNPIQIYDKNSGKVSDFTTEFTFLVNRNGKKEHGDGFAFFIKSPDFTFPDKAKSEGGLLGMFTPENAFNSQQQILLVEFDSFANDWDPNPVTQYSHLGINVNSIKSAAEAPWFSFLVQDGTIATARIEYNSGAKKLSVSVTYPPKEGSVNNGDSSLTGFIDLTTVLPEMVQIGFSAATGDLVETHDILSWSFTSNF